MNVKLMGLLAGLSLAGPALAQESGQYQYGQEEQQQAKGENELKGTVLGARGDELLIQTEDGAAVPLKVSSKTQVDGKPIEEGKSISATLKSDFKEGDEVRTSFNLNEMKNEAVTLKKEQKSE